MVTPVGSGRILREENAKFLEISKTVEGYPSRSSRPSKRLLEYPLNSVYSAAIQNRGNVNVWYSEQSRVE